MTALDEICYLEQQIHEQVRAQEEYEGRALRARIDARTLRGKIEVAIKERSIHEKNIAFVKATAAEKASVSLMDFARSKKNREKADAAAENAQIALAQAESAIARCQEEIEGAGRRIQGLRARLSEYGETIQFPAKESENGS